MDFAAQEGIDRPLRRIHGRRFHGVQPLQGARVQGNVEVAGRGQELKQRLPGICGPSRRGAAQAQQGDEQAPNGLPSQRMSTSPDPKKSTSLERSCSSFSSAMP